MTEEEDFEEIADELDSPKFSALSLSVADKIDFPTPGQQLAENIASLIEPFDQFQKAQRDAIIAPLDELQKARRDAIINLPDEVFTTALTASAVSSRVRTTTPHTQSRSSSESVEVPANQTSNDIDVEAPKFLYLNTAYTLARYIAYRIEALSEKQREDAATVIAAGIVGYAAYYTPQVSESPLVASTSILSVAMFLHHVRSSE